MGWGTVIGLVGSFLGGAAEDKASAKALETQAWAQEQGTASERKMFEEAMGYGDPYRKAGYAGLEAYGEVPMGMTEADMIALTEGTDALRAMQAAQGRRRAGGSAEQLGEYASGFMEDVYNRAYDDLISRANIGSQFATGAANQATSAGRDIAASYIQGAQNIAPYIMARGANKANTYAALGRLGGDIFNIAQSGGGGGGVAGEDFLYGETF